MPDPRRPSRSSLERLRYFHYLPATGGLGGDWDSLDAEVHFADDAELASVLAVLGHAGGTPREDASSYLGTVDAGGERVQIRVIRPPSEGGEGRDGVTFAVYVTPDDVDRAARFEDRLDTQGLRMAPPSSASSTSGSSRRRDTNRRR